MRNIRNNVVLLLIGACLIVLLSGCSGVSDTGTLTITHKPSVAENTTIAETLIITNTPTVTETTSIAETTLSGNIKIGGSTTMQPLMTVLASAYMNLHPAVTVEVVGGGNSVGIRASAECIIDIGMISREPTDSEKNLGLTDYLLARDGIAVIIHPSQSIDNLTIGQVRDIFSGNITNWKEVGGYDAAIEVLARDEGSITSEIFKQLVMGDLDFTRDTVLFVPSVRTYVANNPNSIAFISMAFLDNEIKALEINGAAATQENVKNGNYPIFLSF